MDNSARAARCYVFGVAALALTALAGWAYLFGFSLSPAALGAACVLAASGAVSRFFALDFGFGKTELEIEVGDVAILTALVLGGPLCGLLVAVPSALYRDRLRTLFQASALAISTLVSAYAFGTLAEPLLLGGRLDAAFAFGVVAAGFVFCLSDAATTSVLLRIKYELSVSRLLREVVLPPIPSEVVSVLTTLGTAYAAATFGPVAALTLFSGAAVAVILLHLARSSGKELEDLRSEVSSLRARAEGLEQSLLSSHVAFAVRLVQSLGRKDGRTAALAAASAVYAGDVAEEFGLHPTSVEKLKVAALLQDVGLVGVPDEVLATGPGKLNSVGNMHLRDHAEHGERILSAVPQFEDAARWVRWHHEREDGTGYPDRLRGEWIPLEAKILATASLYASSVLDGPSRPGLSPREARRELTGLAGNALDQTVVRVLLRVLDDRDESYAAAADDRFAFPVGLAAAGSGTTVDPGSRPRAEGATGAE